MGDHQLREVLGSFLTGVTVITAIDGRERPRGMTANSFTSVSLDPPLVLFCVALASPICEVFASSEFHVIHVLGAHQQGLAVRFSASIADRFHSIDWSPGVNGAPVIADTHAWLECTTHSALVAGDHLIVIGRVSNIGMREHAPLGFYRGDFQTPLQRDFSSESDEIEPGSRLTAPLH
ncbi:MAG: flavin reductase family protein [Actinomycetota bacterium]|nr:flavin reductase family protein [Actinomycetota bacterium]